MQRLTAERFVLTLEHRGPDAVLALRGALKVLLRRYGLRCVSIDATANRSGPGGGNGNLSKTERIQSLRGEGIRPAAWSHALSVINQQGGSNDPRP